MIYGMILKKGQDYYTNMFEVLNAIMEEPCFVLELLIDLPWIIDDKEEWYVVGETNYKKGRCKDER